MERRISDMLEANLTLLEETLQKKNQILDDFQGLCDKQMQLLDTPSMQAEEFDSCIEEQDVLTEELIRMNEKTEELYECLQTEQPLDSEQYAEQIERVKALISQIMDKTASLQEKEQSNKKKLEEYFRKERKTFAEGRRSSKAALDYYKSMSKSNVIPPQFMDKKK